MRPPLLALLLLACAPAARAANSEIPKLPSTILSAGSPLVLDAINAQIGLLSAPNLGTPQLMAQNLAQAAVQGGVHAEAAAYIARALSVQGGAAALARDFPQAQLGSLSAKLNTPQAQEAFRQALPTAQTWVKALSVDDADLRQSLDALYTGGKRAETTLAVEPGSGSEKIVIALTKPPTAKVPETAEELMEMFGNAKSTEKNLNPAILAALAARHDVSEAEMKRRIANIARMYPLLEAQKAANTTLRKLFEDDNKTQPQYQAQLSRVQHEAWLANEKTRATYVDYNQKVHDVLRRAVAEGVLLVPTAPVKDHSLLPIETFENPSKKFKFQAKHFAFTSDAQKSQYAKAFKAATGKDFDGAAWEINTISGEWDNLAGLKVSHQPDAWNAGTGRVKFLNGLQQDNVASGLAAIQSQKIIADLNAARTRAEFLSVIVDMSRIVNVGWRLNNPWFGFSYKLQYRPFHPDPAIGIGIEEIRKDTITLKATLELLRDQKDIKLPNDVRRALDGAFARGLGQAFAQSVEADGKALSAAIIKQRRAPVTLSADQSNILEYLSWIFSSQELIEKHMSGDALEVLARAFDAKGRADVVRAIDNALAVVEVLENVQDANDAAHTALTPRIPGKIRLQLARRGHDFWLVSERRALGTRFVPYTPKLHAVLASVIDLAYVEYHGRRLTGADLANPAYRFRLTAANFKRRTEAERAAFADFERSFARITGEAFSDPDGEALVELNTFAAPWTILKSPALSPKLSGEPLRQWQLKRERALYQLQAHAFTPVFTALFDDALLDGLSHPNLEKRQDALFKILRRIDTNTRLDNADRGFNRLKQSYDAATEGGVGIEMILNDAAMLNGALKTIKGNALQMRLPPGVERRLGQVLGPLVLAAARTLTDRDTLVQVVERNRVAENFTLGAGAPQ